MTNTETKTRIESMIKGTPVFLFMKGTPQAPQCGFSARAVAVLMNLGVSFESFDVLEDMDIRSGIKEYSNWPTIPQLYIKGELIGGSDIIMEMYESGELKEQVTTL